MVYAKSRHYIFVTAGRAQALAAADRSTSDIYATFVPPVRFIRRH
jgi:hypothetical protein